MKFKALPITDLTDATLDFEQLQTLAILDKLPTNFLQLLTAGTQRLTSGSSTATFTAASNTPAVSISHGLGVIPRRFWAIPTNGFTAAFWMQVDAVANWTSSTVKTAAFCYTNITATVTFDWIAFG